jgi:outer membrane protein OmpA-like peptidoglycan-associated protein/tetratricopeptide (TPR) repeat protein
MKKSILFIYFIHLVFPFMLNAQTLKKAEKQFTNVAYAASIDTYNQVGEPQTRTALLQMANSYRLNGDYENAEYYYATLMTQSPDNEDVLHYAEVLLSNGKCTEAVKYFQQYQEKTTDKNRSFITSCDDLKAFAKKNIDLSPLNGANSESAEFSAIPYKNGVVFTSNKQGKGVCQDKWTGNGYADMYFAELSGDGVNEAKPFGADLNLRYHDGSATFNKAGNVMYFTRTNPTGKNKNGQRDLKVFISYYKNGIWSEAVEMPFNSDEFTTCHPTLSADGKRLYFASNRPNGIGGMDIWSSRLENGRWSEPQNLGKEVNTSGNEIFPFINDQEELFFASNGHKGLGGLDIFSSKNDNGVFSSVKNMGTPFNSSMDDFAYSEKSGSEAGYLSSNRKGGAGSDDVYSWKKSANLPSEEPTKVKVETVFQAKIIFIDAQDGSVLNTPSVTIAGPNKTPKQEVINNIDLEVVPSGQYTIKGEMPGFLSHTVTLEGIDLVKTPVYKIPLTKNETKVPNAYEMVNNKPALNGKTLKTGEVIELQDIYYDYNKANIRIDASAGLLRLAEVMLRYPSLEVELNSHTDSRGKSEYNMSLSQRRADEAVAYLVSRGISSKRMKARGFGESVITNGCVDGVNCNEEQHQRNRRTEVRVMKFEDESVEIIKK